MNKQLQQLLMTRLGKDRVKFNELMSAHTNFRIGGQADSFYEAKTVEEIREALKAGKDLGIPYFILGIGANILVGERGIRGLVIRMSNNYMEVIGPLTVGTKGLPKSEQTHYQSFDTTHYLKFDDLDLVEKEADTLVKSGAGVSLPVLISWTLTQGLTGLQNFSGIPSSVGGAVYNNIHGGTKLIDQFIDKVVLLDTDGTLKEVSHDEMAFSYDSCRVQKSKEVVVEVVFKLSHGDVEKAEWVRREWLKRKLRLQPQKNCPGCIFKNISKEDAVRIGAPTVAAGWVLDIGLNLKGKKVGGVSVSPQHANFFVNDGTGKASDVLSLIDLCKKLAKDKFDLDLNEEIQKVGEF